MVDVPRVVLTGGVSGGHVFPLIAVSRSLRTFFPQGVEFLFIGSQGKFESEAMTQEGIPAQYVLTGKMRRYFSWLNFVDVFKVPIGIIQALWKLFLFMPDVVFAKGGSASIPVVLAAWVFQIPVMIHDSDAVAGRANRLLARFSTRIAIAYPSAHKYFPEDKTALTGNPVRDEFLSGSAERAATTYGLSLEKKTLLVWGGSQGAQVINRSLLLILPELLKKGIQVIHQTGSENYNAVMEAVTEFGIEIGKSGYIAKDFFGPSEIADALQLSTLVLSRAGAGSIAEIAAVKKPSILVPLESAANDEQRMNAYDIAEIGGALVLEESNLGEHLLLEKILGLMENETLLRSMSEKIQVFYHPDAADTIAAGLSSLMLHS